MTLSNELERMYSILSRIRAKNQNLGQSAKKDSTNRSVDESLNNSYNLIDIT